VESIRGRVLLVGASDAGKTTFAHAALRRLIDRDRRAALLDLDIGQSEVGPPGCLGLALPEAGQTTPYAPIYQGLHFVGSTTPAGLVAECVAGACRLATIATDRGAEVTVIDTGGFVTPPNGLALRLSEVDALQPALILAFQRDRELRPLLRFLPPARVRRVEVGPQVVTKPQQARALRRQQRFRAYLAEAVSQPFALRRLGLRGTRLGQGIPVTREGLRKLTEGLALRLAYAERQGETLFALADGDPSSAEAREVASRARVRLLETAARGDYTGLLVGLLGAEGETLAMGIWEGFDSLGLKARVVAPRVDVAQVRGLTLGTLRIRRDGTELGFVRRGRV
jgi:polynucleotide 5'-hydroxyl-kinase GRC3/NOL9